MDKKKLDKKSLAANLKRLAEINDSLESAEDADPEEALRLVKEAEGIVRAVRAGLKDAENQFREIKKSFDGSDGET